jgi:O-antigen/teichoic acid export membrane protein
MLQILCGFALFSPVTWLTSSLLATEGRTRAVMMLSLLKAVLVLGLILAAGRTGALWACGGVVLGFALYGAAYLAVARRLAGLPTTPVMVATVRPLLASLVMFGIVVGERLIAVGAGLGPGYQRLALEVAAGGVSYLGLAFVLARHTLRELTSLAAGVVRPRTRP